MYTSIQEANNDDEQLSPKFGLISRSYAEDNNSNDSVDEISQPEPMFQSLTGARLTAEPREFHNESIA